MAKRRIKLSCRTTVLPTPFRGKTREKCFRATISLSVCEHIICYTSLDVEIPVLLRLRWNIVTLLNAFLWHLLLLSSQEMYGYIYCSYITYFLNFFTHFIVSQYSILTTYYTCVEYILFNVQTVQKLVI